MSSICPRSSSLLGWCCHTAIILFSLCFHRFLSSVFEAGQDTRVLIFSCCTKWACKKLFPHQNMFPLVSSCWKGIWGWRTQLVLPPAEFCPGQSKASSDHSTKSTKGSSWGSPGSRGTEAAEGFSSPWPGRNWLCLGRRWDSSGVTWHFPNLEKPVGRMCSDPSPCWPGCSCCWETELSARGVREGWEDLFLFLLVYFALLISKCNKGVSHRSVTCDILMDASLGPSWGKGRQTQTPQHG